MQHELLLKSRKIKVGIEAVVPELRALHKDTERKPRVRAYEGVAGLTAGFEDSLTCEEKLIRVISSVEKIAALLPADYFPQYVKQRVGKRIKMHGIHPANKIAREFMKMDIPKLDEAVLIPEEEFKAPADMAIYDDKIGYMSPENSGFSIVIESKELADVMKNIFDMAWAEAKRLNKNMGFKLTPPRRKK